MAEVTIVTPGFTASQGLRTWNQRLVAVSATRLYLFYIDNDSGDARIKYILSTDSGSTWGSATDVALSTGGSIALFEVWYDKWTPNDTGDLIHVAWAKSTSDSGIYHRSITGATGALSSEHYFDSGPTPTTNLNFDKLDITRDRSGDLWIAYKGSDAGGVLTMYRSVNDGVTWTTPLDESTEMTSVVGEIDPENVRHFCLLPGFVQDAPILIVKNKDTAGGSRIFLLIWNTTNDEFDLIDTYADDTIDDAASRPRMGCLQRADDNALFICYVTSGATPTLRCISVFEPGFSFDNLIYTAADSLDTLHSICLYSDLVTGHIYVAFADGPVGGFETKHAKSVNSGFNWDAPITFSVASVKIDGMWACYTNFDTAGIFQLAWWDDDANAFKSNDASDFLTGLYTVREPASGQEVVSCLTGNPEP